jgi:ketosteroid isomerase-like protein
MLTIEESNLAVIRRYFALFDTGGPMQQVDEFYEPDAVHIEFPNRFAPNGVTRDVAAMRASAERGRQIMASQRFELVNAVAAGDTVAVEATWEGTLAVAVANIAAGTTMRARFAIFFELRNGRIRAQRNYDCFDPWQTDLHR